MACTQVAPWKAITTQPLQSRLLSLCEAVSPNHTPENGILLSKGRVGLSCLSSNVPRHQCTCLSEAALEHLCHAIVCLYRFPELLRQLDNSKQRLGVASYGLAVTTLEEVFLKVSLQQGGSDSGSTQQVWGKLSHYLLSSLPLSVTLLLRSLAQARATPDGMPSTDAVFLPFLVTESCLVI